MLIPWRVFLLDIVSCLCHVQLLIWHFYFYQLLHVDVLIFGGVLLQEGTLRWEARRGRPLDILSHSMSTCIFIALDTDFWKCGQNEIY